MLTWRIERLSQQVLTREIRVRLERQQKEREILPVHRLTRLVQAEVGRGAACHTNATLKI